MSPRPPYPRPTPREMLAEIVPLISVIPAAAPPLVLVVGPWLLFALLVAGPFALLLTIVIVLLAVRLLIIALAAIAASPYLLVRHLRAAGTRHPTSSAPVHPAPARLPASRNDSPSGPRWQPLPTARS